MSEELEVITATSSSGLEFLRKWKVRVEQEQEDETDEEFWERTSEVCKYLEALPDDTLWEVCPYIYQFECMSNAADYLIAIIDRRLPQEQIYDQLEYVHPQGFEGLGL